jgi:hypothetical protein
MTSIFSRTIFATCISILPSLALAGAPEPGRLRGSISAGTEIFGDANLHGGTVLEIFSLAADIDPSLPDVPATFTIRPRKYSDVYDAPVQLSAEISYGMSENIEVYGSIYYSKTEGTKLQVGDFVVTGIDTIVPIFGEFSDLKNLGLEAGARYFFGNGGFVPFLGGSIGIVNQNKINVGISFGDSSAIEIPFFKTSTSATIGLEAGLATNFSEQLSGRISVGVKHTTNFSEDDTALEELSLPTINDKSQRTTFPIKASLAATF